jgi:hypothetical protein
MRRGAMENEERHDEYGGDVYPAAMVSGMGSGPL